METLEDLDSILQIQLLETLDLAPRTTLQTLPFVLKRRLHVLLLQPQMHRKASKIRKEWIFVERKKSKMLSQISEAMLDLKVSKRMRCLKESPKVLLLLQPQLNRKSPPLGNEESIVFLILILVSRAHVVVEERLALSLDRDGVLKKLDVRGELKIIISDPDYANIAVKCSLPQKGNLVRYTVSYPYSI